MRTRSLVAVLLLVVTLAGRAAAQPADDQAADLPVLGLAGIEAAIATCVRGAAMKCREAADEMDRLHLDSRYGFTSGALRARADELLDKACTAGDGSACYEQGRYAERAHWGGGAAPGRALIEKACLLRHGDACAYLGDHEKRARAAVALYEQACAGQSAHGCEQLALRLGAHDRERALALHHQACTGDDLIGCEHSGELLRARGDRTGALADLEHACDLAIAADLQDEDVASCDAAGQLETDATRARSLFERACEAGHPLGCVHLGERMARGEGGERNWGAGLETIANGCRLAHDARCRALSKVKKSPPDWRCDTEEDCRARCAEQLWLACERLVEIAGTQFPGDLDGEPLEGGCTRGDALACRALGDGSPTFAQALPWYRRGCKLADAPSCRYALFARALHSARDAATLGRACASERSACALYGLALAKRARERAAEVWREACDAGVGAACRFLARTLDDTSLARDDVMDELVFDEEPRYGTCGCGEWDRTASEPAQSAAETSQPDEARRLLRLGCAAGDVLSCDSLRDPGELDNLLSTHATVPAWE